MTAVNARKTCVQRSLAWAHGSLSRLPLLLAMMLLASTAWAGSFTADGPRTFTRGSGSPAAENVSFTVLDPSAVYELKIQSSTVSSAIITLNGVEIFGTSDFNQQVTTLAKPVTLAATNTLSVELRGKPDETMTITVIGQDDVPPMIRATAAPIANAAGWNNADVTVTFACLDVTSGVAFCPAPVIVDTEGGEQVITGTARDHAGNATTARFTVSLDKTAPAVAVTAPADGDTVTSAETVVTGTFSDAHSGVAGVTCNGTAAALEGGAFTCTVPLVEGANTITVVVTDRAGHTSTRSVVLNNVSTPRVQLTAPDNLSFLNISPITVRGTVSDPNATVRVNGVAATISGGTFMATVPIVEGNNTLTAVAKSTTGKIGTGSVQVTLDTTPPRVAVSSPVDGFETTEATISVAGMVNDVVVGTVNDQQATVTINGVAAEVSNRTFVLPQLALQEGENDIQIIARDRVGNQITARLTVTRLAPTQAVIRTTSGNNQSGVIGGPLAQPLVVTLTDAQGLPVSGKPVVFKVTGGNGQLMNGANPAPWTAVTTDGNGRAAANYVLGTRSGAGNNKVEATATGFAGTALFVASATPGGAAQVNVDAGQNQSGATGEVLAFPFVVVVTDPGHNRLAGVPVTFNVVEGGGKLQNGEATLTATTDSDGRALTFLTLGEEAGFDNNLVHATIPGYTAHPAAFTATAKVPGNEADTKITGVVLDNSNRPLEGVTMRLYQAYLGSNSNIPLAVATPVVTNAQGQFVMTGVPIGSYKLVADGTTIPTADRYPTLEFDIHTVAGQENTVGLPIYLPVLDSVNRLCVNETLGGTLTLPSVPGFSFTVAPGSATFPGGARSGCITVTPVHGDKVPMVPGFGQQPRFVITVQPVGTHFNPPAQVQFPNVDGLQPREVTEMYSYDHDLSTFVAIGTATVSADGSVLRSDPGVGIMKAGWHCGGNPNSTGSAATCPECKKCQGGNCVAKEGTCDDKDKCTENDKCVSGACKGTPIDLGGWINDGTFGGELKLPQGLTDKANQALHMIPGLGGVNFKEANLGASAQVKDCCDKNKGKIEKGLKEGTVSVGLSAEIKDITIFGSPTITKEFDFTIVTISLDFAFGLYFDSSFTLQAEGGLRQDKCKDEDCAFGSISGGATAGIRATAEAIACIETWGTDEACGGVSITPASISLSFSAALTYNKPGCKSGFGGQITVGKIMFKAEIGISLPNVGKLSYEREIAPGFTIGGK